MTRYEPESSGAVLDRLTNRREWFDSFGEAIAVAARRNDEWYQVVRARR